MKKHTFYGSVTVGEKGQIVIPIEARNELSLEKGEKLLAFGLEDGTLFIIKPSQLESYTKELAEKVSSLNNIIATDPNASV